MSGRSRGRKKTAGRGSALIVWSLLTMLLLFFLWASLFELDEVTVGVGKVIPSSHAQIVQSLEGGILQTLKVREGDVVEAGQVLALLDPTQLDSGLQESTARMRAALATAARLQAETAGSELNFPPEVLEDGDLVAAETALYRSRRENLDKTLSGLREALTLINRELKLTASLVAQGAASDVEVLRLKRQANDLQSKLNDAQISTSCTRGRTWRKPMPRPLRSDRSSSDAPMR